MPLLLNDEDVRKLLTIEDTIEALEDAYDQYGRKLVRNPIRREMRTNSLEGGDLPQEGVGDQGIGMNFAYLGKSKLGIVKVYTRFNNVKLLTHLIDTESGKTLAVFHSIWESYMRVAAEAAIGAKYMARKDATVLGMLGTGVVGKLAFPFLLKVGNFKKAYCHAGRAEDSLYAKEYAKEMSEKHGLEVIQVDKIEELVRNADVLVSATRATQPLVKAKWIKRGTHITGIGADGPGKTEYEPEVFKKISKLVIDYGLTLETLQVKEALRKGFISKKDIYGNIGEIVAGIKPGRTRESEITAYMLSGMTVGYVAILQRIYQKAKKEGRGNDTKDLNIPADILHYLFLTERF